MGTIDIFAKWDLEKNGWTQSDNLKDIGRSFAIASYKRIINDNGKILPRRFTGTCAKHQRHVAQEVKRARFMGFVPFCK